MRDLAEGDVLVKADGSRVSVSGLRSWEAAVPVYNLRVADTSTYAVGEQGLAVHNTRGCNKLEPHSKATGPHTRFGRDQDGNITKYQEFTPNGPRKPDGSPDWDPTGFPILATRSTF